MPPVSGRPNPEHSHGHKSAHARANNSKKLDGQKPKRNKDGRPKGSPNKIAADVNMQAFSEAGGADYLRKISKTHPQVFCTLLGKILPAQTQISGDPNNPLQTINRI